MAAWVALGLLISAAIILILRHDAGTIAGFDAADFAGIVAAVALLIYLSGAIFSSYYRNLVAALRHLIIWSALALVLIAAYSYRFELLTVVHRVAGELFPAGVEVALPPGPGNENAVRIRRRADGHFIANTRVNGGLITMIVDTGASSVVLRPDDAGRIGYDVDKLNYTIPVRTANGTSFAARVRLKSISVGKVSANDVEALIARPGALHQSLLGMSFLSRLRSYEFSGDFLTLRGYF